MERGLSLLVGVVLALVLGSSDAQVAPCTELNSCSCQYQDGLILSLSALTRNDGEPAFSNVTDKDHDTFVSWNPCKPFSIEGTECMDTAICAIREGIPKTLYYNLGDQDSAKFKYNDNGSLMLTYTKDHGDFKRSAEITLQCLSDAKFDFFVNDGEQEPYNDTIIYKMVLASKFACAHSVPTTVEPVTTEEPEVSTTFEDACRSTDTCSCQFSDGRKLSLEAVSRADGTPYFENEADKYGELVSWNPCSTFTFEGTNCFDAFLCVASPDNNTGHINFLRIAAELGVTFSVDRYGDQVITYHSVDAYGVVKNDAEITLQCLEDSTTNFFMVDGQYITPENVLVYKMTLASRFACAMRLESLPLKGLKLLP